MLTRPENISEDRIKALVMVLVLPGKSQRTFKKGLDQRLPQKLSCH